MYTHSRLASSVLLMAAAGLPLFSQSVTSARSGTVHYFEGAATIDGKTIEAQKGRFSQLADGSTLTTGQGRVEILLTPGVFLRVGENTSVKMLDSRLLSTRVEFLSGTAMLEADDPEVSIKDPAVTIVYGEYQIQPVKYGLFEFFSEPSQLKVFKGEADVVVAGNHTTVKEGRMLGFSPTLTTEKFDVKAADELYFWTRDRAAYVSAANVASARSANANGFAPSSGGYGFGGYHGGSWYYNTYLDMFTFLPYGRNIYWSPFGYGFFSPYSIYAYYQPGGYYWNGGGAPRNGGSAGQPITSPGRIPRLGVASNHPTLNSPLRSNGTTLRGGFQRGSGMEAPDMSGFGAASRSMGMGSPRGIDTGSSRGGFAVGSAGPAPAAAAPSAGGGGTRGAAVSAPRGR